MTATKTVDMTATFGKALTLPEPGPDRVGLRGRR